MSYEDNVRYAYGFIDAVKLKEGNWSVKVTVHPQPPLYVGSAEPLRYGGWWKPDPQEDPPDEDGYGRWIPLGDTPSDIAMKYGEDIKGQFVEIRFMGTKPWEGRAYIINQASTEQTDVLAAPERGPMRILSAINNWF